MDTIDVIQMRFVAARDLHKTIVDEVPQLKRGILWCTKCGHTTSIDAADALRNGWPRHCGYTMTIDSPEERAARRSPATNGKE
ncbi:hypothetical protein [Taklimakanibacter deserti]|uniref:hypothetical protein n=1 Tax=Taklimakanibacter deserti TaxID=2267839 RepID=UPI0034D566D3